MKSAKHDTFRRVPMLLGFLYLISSAAGTALAAPDRARPNIILIMADDLGYECLGAYGGRSYETPHLDALAESGMRFDNCFSTPKCSPSRVTILTGRYTVRTTMKWGHIPQDEVTFGHVLQRLPTLASLTGADLPQDVAIDGRSFAPQLRGRAGDPREWVFTEWGGKAWVRDKRWKLYDRGMLYDLRHDPEERHPLPRDKAQDVRQRLGKVMNRLKL